MISVIIPTYKRSEHLIKCVESVLNQTYKDIQVIVVDDNDPNTEYRKETEKRMERYINDSRVIYLKHDCNKNGSAARNTGFKFSKGEYICFLDDDDCFMENKLEEQVNFLKNNQNYDGCYCDYQMLNKKNIVNYKKDFSKDILMHNSTPQTSGWLLKRSVIQQLNGFDESYYRHQDYEFLLRFYNSGFKMGKVDKVLYYRNKTQVDNTPDRIKQEKIKLKLLSDFNEIINKYGELFKKRVYLKNYCIIFDGYLHKSDFINSYRIIKNMIDIDFSLTFLEFFFWFYKKKVIKLVRGFGRILGKIV